MKRIKEMERDSEVFFSFGVLMCDKRREEVSIEPWKTAEMAWRYRPT